MAIGFMSFGGMLTGGDEAPKEATVAVAATEVPVVESQEGLAADASGEQAVIETELAATDSAAQDTNTVNE